MTAIAGDVAILSSTVTAEVASAAVAGEAMISPAVAITPVGPWAHAQKDAVIEVARPIITIGRAGIGRIAVIAIGTDWLNPDANSNGWNTYANHNLCVCRWR